MLDEDVAIAAEPKPVAGRRRRAALMVLTEDMTPSTIAAELETLKFGGDHALRFDLDQAGSK